MKKSLAILLSLVLVFSIITSTFAKDVPSIQEQYDILRDAGILDGNNGVMLPEDEIMQRQMLAKIACQLMGVTPIPDVEIHVYSGDNKTNVWGFDEGWIQAAYKAELMEGFTYEDGSTTFNANGIVTMGELMAVIIRAMGLEDQLVDVEGPWYTPFMNLAETEGLVQPNTDGSAKATYDDLIKHTYTTHQYIEPTIEEEEEKEKPEETTTPKYVAPVVDSTAPTFTTVTVVSNNTNLTKAKVGDIITLNIVSNDGGFIISGNSTPNSYEAFEWASGGAANEIDLKVADFSAEMGEGKLGVTVTYSTVGHGDIGDLSANNLFTYTIGVVLSGDTTPPTVLSVLFADNATKGNFIDSDDTITIVFIEAINSETIDASLTTDNPIQGTFNELLGKVGSFTTGLTVDGGYINDNTSLLSISSDLTTVTINASDYTGVAEDIEPTGAFTPLSTIKDLNGNSINAAISKIATGIFVENSLFINLINGNKN